MATDGTPSIEGRFSPLDIVDDHLVSVGGVVVAWYQTLVQLISFSLSTFAWLFTRLPRFETLIPNFYQIGVLTLPVVALTGSFIGMVLAVQSYAQFRGFGLETRMGAVINMTLVRELGPVLAATMLPDVLAARSPPNWARCASPNKSTPCRAWAPIPSTTSWCPGSWVVCC